MAMSSISRRGYLRDAIDKWLERVEKIKNNTRIAVMDGASHDFRGPEDRLIEIVNNFVA